LQTVASTSQLILAKVLDEIIQRIAKKVAEGKKLSDQEIIILYIDHILRTMESRFNEVDRKFEEVIKRLDEVNRRIDDMNRRIEGTSERIDDTKEDNNKRVEDL